MISRLSCLAVLGSIVVLFLAVLDEALLLARLILLWLLAFALGRSRDRAPPAPRRQLLRAARIAEAVEVHYMRAFKAVQQTRSPPKSEWAKIMIARKRNTYGVCHNCCVNVKHGRSRLR